MLHLIFFRDARGGKKTLLRPRWRKGGVSFLSALNTYLRASGGEGKYAFLLYFLSV